MNKFRRFLKYGLSFLSVLLHYNKNSKVLYLHDVHKDTIYAKEDHSMHILEFLRLVEIIKKKGFEIVPMITERRKQVRFCFDDGYRGVWDCRELFVSNGIYPTIFIATSLVGKSEYLNEREIKILSDMGFLIQSHAVSHKPLTAFDDKGLKEELCHSKKTLEMITSKKVEEICLPLGLFNEKVLSLSTRVYARTFLSVPGSYWDDYDRGMIRRVLFQDSKASDIHLSLLGGQEIFFKRLYKQHYHENA